MSPAPVLVLAVGNPSRGDDALGPALLALLQSRGMEAHGAVELLTDFQLQVEHALDLAGRRAVLFVDAALPGTLAPGAGATLTPIVPSTRLTPASHALSPQGVLQVARHLQGTATPAWLLAIEGAHFELGQDLSDAARLHLQQALHMALDWLDQIHPGALPAAPSVCTA
jgi:hydrogenase maturation protease